MLIDEYDKPTIDYLGNNTEEAQKNRNTLKSFYSVLKPVDRHLRFVFITGVSKFNQERVFSDLNNLFDISLNKHNASLCGYTQQELESYFPDHIKNWRKITVSRWKSVLRRSNDGTMAFVFQGFTEVKVYNPFSTFGSSHQENLPPTGFQRATPLF